MEKLEAGSEAKCARVSRFGHALIPETSLALGWSLVREGTPKSVKQHPLADGIRGAHFIVPMVYEDGGVTENRNGFTHQAQVKHMHRLNAITQ